MNRDWLRRSKHIVVGVRAQQENEKQSTSFRRQYCVTEHLIYRLGLYGELNGHTGCVNCLQWNEEGTLLASGSDDFRVILWDPFTKRQLKIIETGHINNIFSVQFVPETGNRLLVTGAGDGKVRVHDVKHATTATSSVPPDGVDDSVRVFTCHFARVKRVVTHRSEPNLIWSAGEDGLVMQFDLRQPTSCRTVCNHALINLNAHLGPDSEIKCLALNPTRSEMMAVGANDHYVRVYDRRMLKPKQIKLRSDDARIVWDRSAVMSLSLENVDYNFPPSSVQYYIAGHLPVKQTDMRRRFRPLTSTYLTFSPCGRDLLVNLGGEQIYLFNLMENRRSLLGDFRKYFDSLPPDGVNGLHCMSELQHTQATVSNGHYSFSGGKNGTNTEFCKLARLIQSLSNKALVGQNPKKRYQLAPQSEMLKQKANAFFEKENYAMAVAYYSEAICLSPKSPVLYSNRAAAYLKREWTHSSIIRGFCACRGLGGEARYPDQARSHTCVELSNEIHSAIFETQESRSLKRKRTRSRSLADDHPTINIFATGSTASNAAVARTSEMLSEVPHLQAQPTAGASDLRAPALLSRNNRRSRASSSSSPSAVYVPRISLQFSVDPDDSDREQPITDDDDTMSGSVTIGLSQQELALREAALDYEQRFCGHCNTTTDIKEANFFGCNGEFIVGGSDDGKFFIWDRKTCNVVRALVGDQSIVNCLQPHPTQCLLATSGIDSTVKLWAPRLEDGSLDPRDVPDQSNAALANQKCMNADPLEVMLMNMGYRLSGLMDSARADPTSNPAVQCHPS